MDLLLHISSLQHFYCCLRYPFGYRWSPFITDYIFIDSSVFYSNIFTTFSKWSWDFTSWPECHQLQKPACQLQKTTLRPSQQLVQTSPWLDEHVFASTTRPILIHQTEGSPLFTPLSSQEIPAPQQDELQLIQSL